MGERCAVGGAGEAATRGPGSGRRRGTATAIVVTAALSAACGESTPTVSLSPPSVKASAGDFDSARDRWTRHGRIIKKLDTTLRVHATFHSPELNAAYVARRAQMFKLPPGDRENLTRQLEREWSESFVFLVAAATIDLEWNNFDSKRSVWRVSLANDGGGQVSASSIRSEPIDATLKELFPFIGRFHRAYTLRFPKVLPDGSPLVGGNTRELRLRFAGPLGEAELVWRLR
jgi:hypothetical protein